MSGIQVTSGKAFEFACIKSFETKLKERMVDVEIAQNSSYDVAKSCYESLPENHQKNLSIASLSAYSILSRLEPYIENSNGNTPLILTLQPDSTGQSGDVRDILFVRIGPSWSIGISMKHNHTAVKHSRLSGVLDFGRQWLDIPCSRQYFTNISPIFNRLKELTVQNVKWSDVDEKEDSVYVPILKFFISELMQIHEANENVPGKLLEYLLGKHDFYKIIAHSSNKTTQIQAFAMHGTLNRSSGDIRPEVRLPKLRMPTEFYSIAMKPNSKTTLIVVCNNGWQISMRIHNARSLVEPSLKFDVKLIGQPSIYTHHEPWRIS